MPSRTRCIVIVCNNSKRYPEHQIKHSNVKESLAFYKLPTERSISRAFIKQINKGRSNFVAPNNFFVCSNHFLDGKHTKLNLVLTLFLTISYKTVATTKKHQGRG